jgi:hypothetical protein
MSEEEGQEEPSLEPMTIIESAVLVTEAEPPMTTPPDLDAESPNEEETAQPMQDDESE